MGVLLLQVELVAVANVVLPELEEPIPVPHSHSQSKQSVFPHEADSIATSIQDGSSSGNGNDGGGERSISGFDAPPLESLTVVEKTWLLFDFLYFFISKLLLQ